MPRATVDENATERYELETLPEGYVVLKKMTFGERARVREMTLQASMSARGSDDSLKMMVSQVDVDEYEFSHSIVEHNLEDANGNLLQFTRKGSVASLDPAVGAEISKLIDEMNSPKIDPKVS